MLKLYSHTNVHFPIQNFKIYIFALRRYIHVDQEGDPQICFASYIGQDHQQRTDTFITPANLDRTTGSEFKSNLLVCNTSNLTSGELESLRHKGIIVDDENDPAP